MTGTATRLTDRITWLAHCHEEDGRHRHLSQFLVEAGEDFVLVDAGSGGAGELVDRVEELTDGAGVDTLLLTHSILPHTGNVRALLAAWPAMTVVAAASIPELVGLPPSVSGKRVRTVESFSGTAFTFLDPLLTDVVLSTWIYDRDDGTLFTAEGVGHYHSPGDCSRRSDELAGGIAYEHVHAFHRDTLPFLEYVDPAKLRRAFEAVFDEIDVEWILPAHGTPVVGDDVPDYVDLVVRSARELAEG